MTIASSSRFSNKDIEKTVVDAEQFAAVLSFQQVFCEQKVLYFVLQPTKVRNDTREDEQGNNNAYTKTQQSNLTRERHRKGAEVRGMDGYATDGWCFAFTS